VKKPFQAPAVWPEPGPIETPSEAAAGWVDYLTPFQPGSVVVHKVLRERGKIVHFGFATNGPEVEDLLIVEVGAGQRKCWFSNHVELDWKKVKSGRHGRDIGRKSR